MDRNYWIKALQEAKRELDAAKALATPNNVCDSVG
jgi:hypothetical protein